MLEFYKSPARQADEDSASPGIPLATEASLADHVATVSGFIRRQFPIILSIMPLTVGVAIAYLYTTPPRYTAQARMLIDTGKIHVSNQPIFGESPVDMAIVDSQVEVMKSDTAALSIVKDLHLAQDPEFVGSTPGLIEGTIYRLINLFGPKTESALERRALETFERRLTVSRMGLTYVIGIEFQSTDPDRAAQIANAVADGFVRDQIDARYQTIGRATAWLQDRLNELRAQASAAEHTVVEYKARNNIVDTNGHLINEQQLSELNTALLKARADTAEAKARLDRVAQIVSSGDLDPSAMEVATVADALHNEVISKLRQQYLELAQREALFTNRLGRDHLAVVNLRNQMRELRRSMFDEFKRIGEADKSDYDIAKARENSLQESLASTVAGSQTTNKAQIELRQLESAAQSYRTLYNTFQQRYTDFVQQQSFPMNEVQITRALPPTIRSSPKSVRVLAISAVVGLALGAGLAMLREILDHVFRTGRQVEERLRTDCLSMLPLINPKPQDTPGTHVDANYAIKKLITPKKDLLRHVVDSPLSQFAESIRALKVAADLSGASKSNKIIGVTSSMPEEGKSTIAASLAQLCAHSGARVILVDCDLRKRSLTHNLAPKATKGIIDVLTEAASFDQVIWSDPSTKLCFLPALMKSRMAHTSEVLSSAAMKRLFERLRQAYDYVIVDLPPLGPVVDVRSATHLVDCYLFVIEWGKTNISIVERSLNAARGVYDNLLGVVLNKVDFLRLDRYDHNAYYARYDYYAE